MQRLGIGLLLAALLVLPSIGQGDDRESDLPLPRQEDSKKAKEREQEILAPQAVQNLAPAVPVCLGEIVELATLANLDIVQAKLVVERARANVLQTQSAFLPNLNLGSTYTEHEGTIQRTEGTVIRANRDSLFVGAGTVIGVGISEAIFSIPEARRRLEAAFAGQARVTNDTLLRVADAYFAVLRARRQLARLDETLEFLLSNKESELRGNSKGLLPIITAFVKTGNALPSDQTRVEADVVRRMTERSRAAQDVRTAAAELARLLHLDPTAFLLPCEDYRWPIPIPGKQWLDQSLDVLVKQALLARPELAENASLIEAAYLRYQQAKYQPLLPNLVGTYSYGGFGGGPRVVRRSGSTNILGPSGTIADFDQRHDLEVSLVWRLRGLGVGNSAQAWDARVRLESRQVQQQFLQDVVVRDVVQAQESVKRSAERVVVAQAGLFDDRGRPEGAIYRSLRLNFLRIRGGQGLPLEVLDSTRRLSDVLSEYANALTDYDQSRFRMLVALGMPAAGMVDPRLLPLPPGCAPPAPVPVPNAPPGEIVKKESQNMAEPAKDQGANPKNDPGPMAPTGVEQKGGPSPKLPVPRPAFPSRPVRSGLPDDGLLPLPPIK